MEILGYSPVGRSKSKPTPVSKKKENSQTKTSPKKIPAGARTKFTGEKSTAKARTGVTGEKSTGKRKSGIEGYRGPPDGVLPDGNPWPEGWTKVTVERTGGQTSGRVDKYWFSPGNHKFRSKVDIQRFLKALSFPAVGGDEVAALKIYKDVRL